MHFNPKTAFRGPFGPQTTLTADIFVIGLIYLLLIFIPALEVHYGFGVQTDPSLRVTLVF